MNQPAIKNPYEPEAVDRSVVEQMALNRSAVAAAENDRLREAVHPGRWERYGFFRRLRRRPGLSEVA